MIIGLAASLILGGGGETVLPEWHTCLRLCGSVQSVFDGSVGLLLLLLLMLMIMTTAAVYWLMPRSNCHARADTWQRCLSRLVYTVFFSPDF